MGNKRSGKSAGRSAGKEITIGGFTRKELKELRVKATRGLVKNDDGFENLVVIIRSVRNLESRLRSSEWWDSVRDRESCQGDERSLAENEPTTQGQGVLHHPPEKHGGSVGVLLERERGFRWS